VGSSLHYSQLNEYNSIVLQILHINNYLILVLTKLKWVYGCIFSEKVVMEISALKVRVFGKK